MATYAILADAAKAAVCVTSVREDGFVYASDVLQNLCAAIDCVPREASSLTGDEAAGLAQIRTGDVTSTYQATAADGWIDRVLAARRDSLAATAPRGADRYVASEASALVAGLAVLESAVDEADSDRRASGMHGMDTDRQVFFYEHDFYVLSNFSAFSIWWEGRRFGTSEAAYHWMKFAGYPGVQDRIAAATSAHEAFKIARAHASAVRPDWDLVKVEVMREILLAKVAEHPYVRVKLLATGQRELVEDSWRDDFWGWGPDRSGRNQLGKLWMEIRDDLRRTLPPEGEG